MYTDWDKVISDNITINDWNEYVTEEYEDYTYFAELLEYVIEHDDTETNMNYVMNIAIKYDIDINKGNLSPLYLSLKSYTIFLQLYDRFYEQITNDIIMSILDEVLHTRFYADLSVTRLIQKDTKWYHNVCRCIIKLLDKLHDDDNNPLFWHLYTTIETLSMLCEHIQGNVYLDIK